MARNQNYRSMPGSFSQYRDDQSNDSDSSEKSSASKEAPRGPESPAKQSATQPDEDVEALSSRFGLPRPDDPPPPALVDARAAEEPKAEEHIDGELASRAKRGLPADPGLHGLLGRPAATKPPKEQTAPAPPTSEFLFVASADTCSTSFGPSSLRATPLSEKTTLDISQSPPRTDFAKYFGVRENVSSPLSKPLSTDQHQGLFGRKALSLFNEKQPSLFSSSVKSGLAGPKWGASGAGRPGFFGSKNLPLKSGESNSPITRSNHPPGGQFGDQTKGLGLGLNVQTDAESDPPEKALYQDHASPEIHPASAKRQSEVLKGGEDAVKDEEAPAKRLFGQSRLTDPEMPQRYVPEASTVLQPIKPTFKSSEDFISFAKKTISMSASDLEAITPGLKSLYVEIVNFTKHVVSNTRTEGKLNAIIADGTQSRNALSERTQLPGLPRDAMLETWMERAKLDKMMTEIRTALNNNLTSLRSIEDCLLERVVDSIQSFSIQAWNPKSITEDSKHRAEEYNTRVNELRLEILGLEAKLQKMESRATLAETAGENSRDELDCLRSEHRVSLDIMRQDNRTELNNVRSKSGRDQRAAIGALKAKYARQIEDAEGKLRLHKQTMARNDELETTIRDLEGDRYNLGLAKAAVEKELEELKNQVTNLRMYEDGYKQIEKERDDFESSYNDMKAERDDLQQIRGTLPDTATSPDSAVSVPRVAHSNVGILNSYDEDLGVLEAYWDRQKQFAELAVRDTAAELRQMEAQIAEITLQISSLQGIDPPASEGEDDFSESGDDAEDAAKPGEEQSSSRLLDTLAEPLAAEDSYPVLSATAQAFMPAQRQPQTYATRAVAPRADQTRGGRAYIETSNRGAGVTTAKEVRAPESDGWTEVKSRRAK